MNRREALSLSMKAAIAGLILPTYGRSMVAGFHQTILPSLILPEGIYNFYADPEGNNYIYADNHWITAPLNIFPKYPINENGKFVKILNI